MSACYFMFFLLLILLVREFTDVFFNNKLQPMFVNVCLCDGKFVNITCVQYILQ